MTQETGRPEYDETSGSASFDGLKPPRRQKLAETVAQQLLEEIRKLPVGTRIPSERELTQRLGVGRSTIREALNGLALIGVVKIRHGQGMFVAEAPPTEGRQAAIDAALAKGVTHELLEARRLIEGDLAYLAAERRTEGDLSELEASLEAYARTLTESEDPAKLGGDFHLLVAEAAHNEVLTGVLKSFFELMMERGPLLYQRLPDFAEWELSQHRHIFDAIQAAQPAVAAERMREHVESMAGHYKDVGEA